MKPRRADPQVRAAGISRRAFLQLGTALGAAFLQPAARPSSAPLRSLAHTPKACSLSIASVFPLPCAHQYFPSAERLLDQRLDAFDLLLVPAYAAAELIRRGALQTLPGVPGRPHDPDGAYTLPYLTAISALVYHRSPPSSLDDLWTRDALWPDSSRLVIGAALLRHGYPLNDTHPSHLAQAGEDLLRLRPRLVPDPLADLRSGLASLALAAISVPGGCTRAFDSPSLVGDVPGRQGGRGVSFSLPSEGAACLEYDWVIPHGAHNAEAALDLISLLQPPVTHDRAITPTRRLTPLTPLPTRALAQRASIWKRLKEALI
jgi:spermidine/putrescine-binding protein